MIQIGDKINLPQGEATVCMLDGASAAYNFRGQITRTTVEELERLTKRVTPKWICRHCERGCKSARAKAIHEALCPRNPDRKKRRAKVNPQRLPVDFIAPAGWEIETITATYRKVKDGEKTDRSA